LTKMKLTSSSSNTVRKCQMRAKETYNATIRRTKSLPPTTEGGRKVRKPTTNSKCHGVDDREVYGNTVSVLHCGRQNACRRDSLWSTNLRWPPLASSLSFKCSVSHSLSRTLAFPFLSLVKFLFSVSIYAARVT